MNRRCRRTTMQLETMEPRELLSGLTPAPGTETNGLAGRPLTDAVNKASTNGTKHGEAQLGAPTPTVKFAPAHHVLAQKNQAKKDVIDAMVVIENPTPYNLFINIVIRNSETKAILYAANDVRVPENGGKRVYSELSTRNPVFTVEYNQNITGTRKVVPQMVDPIYKSRTVEVGKDGVIPTPGDEYILNNGAIWQFKSDNGTTRYLNRIR
jgi:hypothetical protein